ncbi:MAG: DUF3769 domain-containing protein [Oscillatoriales cyanobacterium RM2_1_1]|nr:DUF3769 domain-containing protein [Oscillatoriales cyanobacterium SM2_3_0]NJO44445.1 DUF3769 domain-containing protein [Oscillatoriales cyanobacterium RM2_1_1]
MPYLVTAPPPEPPPIILIIPQDPSPSPFNDFPQPIPDSDLSPSQIITRLDATVSYPLALPTTEGIAVPSAVESTRLGSPLAIAADGSVSPPAAQFRIYSAPEQLIAPDPTLTTVYSRVAFVPVESAIAAEFFQPLQAQNSPSPDSPNSSETESLEDPQTTPTSPEGGIPVILPGDSVEITADRQEYDQQRQIITATGNVMIRFRQALIDADQAQVNLVTRQVVATGNVALTRGGQVVRGNRMEYNLGQSTGTVFEAQGNVLTSSAPRDFAPEDPLGQGTGDLPTAPISDRITAAQPVENITSGEGADVNISGLALPGIEGNVNRLRFEADQIDIAADGTWEATNVRITNDPFSPPELELRADTARLNRISPLQDELITTGSRLVFDQRFSLPLFRDRTVIDRRQREPSPISVGYDLDDLGGYFVQWNLPPILLGSLELEFAPQFLLQRALEEENSPFDEGFYGLRASLSGPLGSRTFLDSQLRITDFAGFPNLEEDGYRGSVRLRQQIGDYTLTGEYSYRDRLFNGTLGFQTVQRSVGAVLTSPVYELGNSGAQLRFQAGYQQIEARTDRLDLLDINRDNDRIDRGRFQALFSLTYPVMLWQGEPLPATATEGLRYTPRPVIPFVRLVFIAQGVTSLYTEDESQSFLVGGAGVQGQLGHFSDDFFDYTGFTLFYSQVVRDGESPFLFDRRVDDRVLTLGLVQQIYGGVRAGFESSINLDNGLALNNEFTLEYSRRTYGVLLRINPVRRIGSLNLRISDFNWTGNPEPFSGTERE